MDLNQLLYHHQIALIEYATRDKGSPEVRSRFDLVRHYEIRIARLRQDMGVSTYPQWS
ncbi:MULTISPECIES: hypothetical protein [Novosphingobium]|jgi:hypothetical protein|uniref:hypothetical protein n=1 Tax=Novosphingobium TaxID=165696 RepID=UPI0022F249A1|nr:MULTISPECIES: hypothetical protein [Novosphingobium]GLK45891.1 hypothetical protein GCM10017612_38110 [Novosphingobium resinovorum]